jgi:hypothetical protein
MIGRTIMYGNDKLLILDKVRSDKSTRKIDSGYQEVYSENMNTIAVDYYLCMSLYRKDLVMILPSNIDSIIE